MAKLVIALCGNPRVGKDTVAKHLVAYHGFKRVGFADPIYIKAHAINPRVIIRGELGRLNDFVNKLGWDFCKEEKEVREFLQILGTEAGRNIYGDDCLIKIALAKINKSQRSRFVINDMRNFNEYVALDAYEKHVWHITKECRGRPNNHATEQLDYAAIATHTIANDSSVSNLHALVDAVLIGAANG